MRLSSVLVLLLLNLALSGATYYIDPAGNNSNSGSGSAPWKTLAYACSKATAAGDIIHVNAGTYLETTQCVLAVGVSIEGVGATSIIKSHYVGGSDMNAALIMLSGGTNTGQHISGIKLDGDALTGDKAIVVNNRSNVSIYNCTIVDFATQGIRFCGSGNFTGNSIHNCIITNNSQCNSTRRTESVSLHYQTGFLFYDNTLNNTSRADAGLGLKVWEGVNGLKIYDCNLTGPRTVTGGNYYPFVIECWDSDKTTGNGMEIYDNIIRGQVDLSTCVKGTYEFGLKFYGNTVGYDEEDIPSDPSSNSALGLQFEETMNDIYIFNNTFKNIDRGIYFCSNGTSGSIDGVWIYNNIFQNLYFNWQSQTAPLGSSTYVAHGCAIVIGGGSAFTGPVNNINIWNNDFSTYQGATNNPGELAIFLPTTNTCTNVRIQNNIIVGFTAAPFGAYYRATPGTLSGLTIQKNILYGNGNSNNLLTAGFTPTSVTNDGGIKSDPLFVSSTDFHLQPTSPAIGKGMTLAGLTTDYEGKTLNIPPSIGAYESGSTAVIPAAIPVYQNSVVANATPSLLTMTYNMTLANVVPVASAFSVRINSVARTVTAVVVSGTQVKLTLASPVVSGDVVTVTYTLPAINPLQTTSGGIAASISNQAVSNNRINIAPTAVITSPVTNSSFTALSSITITASASDADGSIGIVEFYSGSTRLGSKSAAPYTFTWSNVAAGTYSLTAIATDNLSMKTTSPAVAVSVINDKPTTNRHPIVKISNPRKGIVFDNLSTITIDAIASDPDGTVNKVEFYNGMVKLVELTSTPYTYTWKDVAVGSYSITAIATDNLNDTTISAPVEFVVGARVKYDANSDVVKLYPNPNDGHFSIELLTPLLNEKSEIVITDMAGKQVFNGPLSKEETLKQFDLSGSKSGVYVMLIKDKEILVTKKFIKN